MTEEKTWTWTASGENKHQIEVHVRDGKHAGPNGLDDRKSISFEIIDQNSPPFVNDLVAAQDIASELIWTASATDPDGDQILYRFYLNNNSMTEWTYDKSWTLNTEEANVGDNYVEVHIRDGRHKAPDDYDDTKSVQFKLSSMKLMVQTWEKTLGEGIITSAQQTSDGGYIVAIVRAPGSWLVKTDAYGNELWHKTIGMGTFVEASQVQQTSDGGYVISGDYMGDGWLLKTDANGNKLWDKTFDGVHNISEAQFSSVKQTLDGGYILGGFKPSQDGSSIHLWLMKTDTNGNDVWSKTFGGSYKP